MRDKSRDVRKSSDAGTKEGKEATAETPPRPKIDVTPKPGGNRTLDFVCPFRETGFFCPHVLSPRKQVATPKETKLLIVLGKDSFQTKVGCTRCEVFREVWKREMSPAAHLRYLLMRLRQGGRPPAGSHVPT